MGVIQLIEVSVWQKIRGRGTSILPELERSSPAQTGKLLLHVPSGLDCIASAACLFFYFAYEDHERRHIQLFEPVPQDLSLSLLSVILFYFFWEAWLIQGRRFWKGWPGKTLERWQDMEEDWESLKYATALDCLPVSVSLGWKIRKTGGQPCL